MAFQIVAIGNQVTWMPGSDTSKTDYLHYIHIKLFHLSGC